MDEFLVVRNLVKEIDSNYGTMIIQETSVE